MKKKRVENYKNGQESEKSLSQKRRETEKAYSAIIFDGFHSFIKLKNNEEKEALIAEEQKITKALLLCPLTNLVLYDDFDIYAKKAKLYRECLNLGFLYMLKDIKNEDPTIFGKKNNKNTLCGDNTNYKELSIKSFDQSYNNAVDMNFKADIEILTSKYNKQDESVMTPQYYEITKGILKQMLPKIESVRKECGRLSLVEYLI